VPLQIGVVGSGEEEDGLPLVDGDGGVALLLGVMVSVEDFLDLLPMYRSS
jgi:hypothetical protein